MNISAISFSSPVRQISSRKIPAFSGSGSLHSDVFQSSLKTVKLDNETVKGSFIKDISLKDRQGNNVSGFIIQNKDNFYACTGDTVLCRMNIKEKKDCIYISELYGQNNKGKYKGAGTELIKYAVEQSRNKGHEGVIKLFMAGSPSFYYKNNFRMTEESDEDYIGANAILDYCTRYGETCSSMNSYHSFAPLMVLDKKGADALMQGIRLTDESKSQKLYDKVIDLPWETLDAVADFCDFGDRFAIQLISKDGEGVRQITCLTGKNENGKLVSSGADDMFDDYFDEEAVQNALYEALDYVQKNIYDNSEDLM